jgi:uncharacterized protein YyaL (SSP411 family)
MPNRLALESSPYLLQHAHNPVDWYPWGDEAFEKARFEDRPVFLSIGYSSCHWCHVMERESFENEEIARFLNAHFVSIKVDREERPDVDDVYMTAVQLTSGRGGWPLSAFLLSDRKPFFAGTYFPPDDRHGSPGFLTLLRRLEGAWRENRAGLTSGAAVIGAEVALASGSGASGGGASGVTARGAPEPLSPASLGLLGSALSRLFDPENGGFGDAPKFPPHLALAWLLRRGAAGDGAALSMAEATLEAMALGGIRDHLGGGFHRYSTDAHWLVPHFEKMLTDNAQLLGVYARAYALTGNDLFAGVARETADYLRREMTGPEGGFYASTDADSEGEEGKYFVWDLAQIRECLGETEGSFFCEWYGVREGGNFREEATGRGTGASVLFLSKKISLSPGAEERLAPLRLKLLDARAKRIPPALDDKRIAGWIALAVSGLAIAGRILNDVRFLEAARAGARFLLEDCRDGAGRLQRTWKDGVAKIPAFLEDEAFFVHALLDLAEADDEGGPGVWRDEAIAAAASMRERFKRKDGPGFTFSGEGNEELLVNARDLFDKATPSSSGAAAWALARLALKTGDMELAREAREAVDEVVWLMARSPHGTESWYFAYETLLEFEDTYGLLPLEDTGAARRPRSPQGSGDFSLKVIGGHARGTPLHVEGVAVEPRVARGEKGAIRLRLTISEGWHLQEPDGLRVEAQAESGFTFEEIPLPPPSRIEDTGGEVVSGWHGTFEADISFSVSGKASKGKRDVTVRTRYRACGEGSCRSEAVLDLSIPIEIA